MSPEYKDTTDEELLSQSIRGDINAFGHLYERYLLPVFRYIYYRIGEVGEAEDITEGVFLKAWEAIPKLKPGKMNFRAWIYRIAHNVIIDRHRTYRPIVSLTEAASLEGNEDSPEKAIQTSELTTQLIRMIRKLSIEQQNIIIYRFLMGYSHADIAKILQLSEVHVRVIQHRALSKMKDFMLEEVISNE